MTCTDEILNVLSEQCAPISFLSLNRKVTLVYLLKIDSCSENLSYFCPMQQAISMNARPGWQWYRF